MTTDLVRVFFRVVLKKSYSYRTDELEEPVYARQYERLDRFKFPPVTGYRLLTSITVSVFGIVKAHLAYRNVPSVTNTFDWVGGTVVTSL